MIDDDDDDDQIKPPNSFFTTLEKMQYTLPKEKKMPVLRLWCWKS